MEKDFKISDFGILALKTARANFKTSGFEIRSEFWQFYILSGQEWGTPGHGSAGLRIYRVRRKKQGGGAL
jgi:hypothetical protein